MYLPNGYIIWQECENYIKTKERKRGYKHVLTPPLASTELYKTSGHLEHYKDSMFPIMEVEGEDYVLRPMNCPHHMMIYGNDIHSYRDLPLRIAEVARDCRYEASGALKGIERTRAFCQNDSHIFCTPEQIESEFKGVVDLILEVYKELGIKNFRFELSLRDPNDKVKYHPDDEMWDNAENKLRDVLNDLGIEYKEMIGEAAFYGPKLDVQVKPAVGNEITLSTCQLVIHRAILGSLDRFIAFYLEETKGALPLWMSPTQVNIIPVNNEYHLDYAKSIFDELNDLDIRCSLDDRDEKLGYKMRESVIKKNPITLILGQKEVDDKTISFRRYGSNDTETISKDDFIKLVLEEIAKKK